MTHDTSRPAGLSFRHGHFSLHSDTGIGERVMKGSEILITGKLNSVPVGNQARFSFQLSESPDSLWRAIFAKESRDMPVGMNHQDFVVSFESETVVLTCLPVNLEGKYRHLKDSFTRVNAKYALARTYAMEAGKKRDEEEQRKKESAETAQVKVQSLFDKLEL